MDTRITETGSDLPRAVLAYTYSILHVMHKFSTSTFCPIVLDSPNQQGQDPNMLQLVLEFIRDQRPVGSQLILGLEDSRGVQFPGTVVELTEERSVLAEGEYEELTEEFRRYLLQTV